MMDHQFRKFLLSRSWEGKLVDFANDALADQQLPDPRTWEELSDYLAQHTAVPGAVEAAEYIWHLYVGAQRS